MTIDLLAAADRVRASQPDPNVVSLSRVEFDALLDYSASLPTGVTVGKQWKRGEPYGKPTTWWLGEYVEQHDDPGEVGIKWRRIVLAEESSATGEKNEERRDG